MFTKIERTKNILVITFETAKEADEFHDWYIEKGADLELCAPYDLGVDGYQVLVSFNLDDCLSTEPVNDLLCAMLTKFYEGTKQ